MSKTIRIIVFGDKQTGKTSLIRKYMGRGFRKLHYENFGTEIAYVTYSFDMRNHAKKPREDMADVDIQIIEVPNSQFDEFLLKERNFAGNTGMMLVFDVTRFESYFNLTHQLSKILEQYPRLKLPILMVANKTDRERTISDDDIQSYVATLKEDKQNKSKFVEYVILSVKEDNVDHVFKTLADEIIRNIPVRKGKFILR